MKTLLFLSIICICTSIKAQSKNSFGFYFTGNAAFRALSTKSNDPFVQSGVDARNEREIFKPGVKTGVNFERKLNERIAFLVGLGFASDGYQTEKVTADNLRFSDQILPKKGFMPPTAEQIPFEALRLRTTIYDINLPVGVTFFKPLKNIKLFINGGVNTNYLVKVRRTGIEYKKGKNEKTKYDDEMQYYNRLNFAALLSFGVEKDFFGYTFRAFHSASYALTNYYSSKTAYKMHPYSFGLGIGVYKAF